MLSMEGDQYVSMFSNNLRPCLKHPYFDVCQRMEMTEGESDPEDDLLHNQINGYSFMDVDANEEN